MMGKLSKFETVNYRQTSREMPIDGSGPGYDLGSTEPEAVAERFGLSRASLAATLGLGMDALSRKDRADAPKTRQRIVELLEIVVRVREWAGSETAAMAWYRAVPIPAFGARTAEAIVKDGYAHLVRDYLDHLALGGYA